MTVNDRSEALFIGTDGVVYPENLICSGVVPAELDGQPCPYSVGGGIAQAAPLDEADPNYSIDKGAPGDLCPSCAKSQLSNLGHWQGHGGLDIPEHLQDLRLFKCRMWFWLVVPGLSHQQPTVISPQA